MKKIIYFILAILTIAYVAFLCYFNLAKGAFAISQDWLVNVAVYGGSAIAVVYALINFFGNPLKGIFFTLLAIVVVIFVLTLIVPDFFRNLLGMNAEEAIKIFS